jgi:two-component system LytT family response regulator
MRAAIMNKLVDHKISYLVVDNDPVLRRILIETLSRDPSTRQIDECSNGMEAISLVRELKPDILICEIESPGIDGFALLETLPDKYRPVTIFISNHNHFAARAFEVSALDYLVKPLSEIRFLKALDRARSEVERIKSQAPSNALTRQQHHLTIRTGRTVNFIKCDELDWVEAEGKYVRLHMGKESLVLRMSISALEAELDPSQFVRIHRSTIVNIERVRRVQPWNYRRTYQVILQDGTILVLSRKSKLRELKPSSIH